MPKHCKDKQYQSYKERRQTKSTKQNSSSTSGINRLPFNCCALTLTPFKHPVCTSNGVIFENDAILPYILKYKKDPVTGNPMSSRDLITLNMATEDDDNNNGRKDGCTWQCPVLNKVFTNHTKIVAIRDNSSNKNEAYVYSYEAVYELNIKPKNYVDLTTGNKFSPTTTKEGKGGDLIILQDTQNQELENLRDIHSFQHTKELRKQNSMNYRNDANNNNGGSGSGNIRHSVTASRIMDKIETEKQKRKKQQEAQEEERKKRQKLESEKGEGSLNNFPTIYDTTNNKFPFPVLTEDLWDGVQLTSGVTSSSLTSTSASTTTRTTSNNTGSSSREATPKEILKTRFDLMRKRREKGYVRMITNRGILDIELHCDICPETTTNFLYLCELGFYNKSKFHRSIPNFMVQGGKPYNSRKKKQEQELEEKKKVEERSMYGTNIYFSDEFDDRLKHDERGLLSMANSGSNTNKCQFFITTSSKPLPHLDRKHSIFGRVILSSASRATEDANTNNTNNNKSSASAITLDTIENIPADPHNQNIPFEKIQIQEINILVDPHKKAQELEFERITNRVKERLQREEKKRKAIQESIQKTTNKKKKSKKHKSSTSTKKDTAGTGTALQIGKYLSKHKVNNIFSSTSSDDVSAFKDVESNNNDKEAVLTESTSINRLPKPPKKTTFGNFSSW